MSRGGGAGVSESVWRGGGAGVDESVKAHKLGPKTLSYLEL